MLIVDKVRHYCADKINSESCTTIVFYTVIIDWTMDSESCTTIVFYTVIRDWTMDSESWTTIVFYTVIRDWTMNSESCATIVFYTVVKDWTMNATVNPSLSHPGIPGVTLCFCTGSYAARPAPPAAADSCSRDNFWTTFWISFIFGTIVGPDL